jgi:hypothetical protein
MLFVSLLSVMAVKRNWQFVWSYVEISISNSDVILTHNI